MQQLARAIAGRPRMFARALLVCFFAALWLLLSHAAASADEGDERRGIDVTRAVPGVGEAVSAAARDAGTTGGDVGARVRDTVATARQAVDDRGDAVDPVVDAVRDVDAVREVEDTGRRAVEETVRTVRATADAATGTVRGTTEQADAIAQEATGQVAEAVAPRPAPRDTTSEASVREVRDVGGHEDRSKASQVHESLVTQENPALLGIPAAPPLDVVEAAVGAAGSTLLAAPSTPAPEPVPGHAPGHSLPTQGGSGPLVPTSAQAAYLGGFAAGADLDLVIDALERALTPPAERATSPGTTPD